MKIKIELNFGIKNKQLTLNDIEAMRNVLVSFVVDDTMKNVQENFDADLDIVTVHSTYTE